MEKAEIKSIFFTEWQGLCQRLGVEKNISDKIGQELFIKYSEKQRYYHTAEHIVNFLTKAKEAGFEDKENATLAIFFHDSIYALKRGRHSSLDEIESALYARDKMKEMGLSDDRIEKVMEYILATVSHKDTGKKDINKFVDLDISIMAADRQTYKKYAESIKAEYSQIWPLEKYLAGRNKFLMDFAARDNLFLTEEFRGKYENQALKNILSEISGNQRELAALQSKTGVYAGSFDPITRGHMGIIAESIIRLDKLVIGIGSNPDKAGKYMFTADERVNIAKSALDDFVREVQHKKGASAVEKEAAERIKDGRCKIVVEAYDGLTIDLAIKHGATQLIRGLRPAGNDFNDEIQITNANKKLAEARGVAISTTYIQTPDERYIFASSSLVKMLATQPKVINEYLYNSTAEAVNVRVAQKANNDFKTNKDQPIIIGFTGSIGTGKSTLCGIIGQNFDAKIYDADEITKQILSKNKNVIKEISNKLPGVVVDGKVVLPALKELVFSDENKFRQYEQIVIPAVRKEIERIIREEKKTGKNKFVVIEVPLLFEKNMQSKFDYTMAVVVSPKTQIDQVMQRGRMDLGQVAKILSKQTPQEIKMMKADYVISNEQGANVEGQLNNIMSNIELRAKNRHIA